jgi:hypothetical protein
VGCIISPLRGLVFLPSPRFAVGFSFRRFAALTGGTPVLHRDVASCKHFYSYVASRVLKNRMESAMVARFGPAYLMILSAAKHLPGQRLKPQLISLSLRHD